MSARDLTTVDSVWIATLGLYLGYELAWVKVMDGYKSEICLAWPAEDYKIIMADFDSGQCSISDLDSFIKFYYKVLGRIKQARSQGGNWSSSDYINGIVG